MNEWVENPMAHTALDDILPCVDNATAQETMSQSKEVEFRLVEMVNYIINNVSNINPPPSFPRSLNYNQSGPLVPTLCNTLTANKTDRTCQAGELQFDNATRVWRDYVCQVSTNGTCTTMGRLTPKMYQEMSVAVNVSDGLAQYTPFLTGLLDCSFVRETFIGIHKDHCPDLNRFSEWVYIGLAMVSVAVMLSMVLWVLFAREKKHRRYTKIMIGSTPGPVTIYRQWK
ncbi:putative transmembrane protein [Helianthus anomalus]